MYEENILSLNTPQLNYQTRLPIIPFDHLAALVTHCHLSLVPVLYTRHWHLALTPVLDACPSHLAPTPVTDYWLRNLFLTSGSEIWH